MIILTALLLSIEAGAQTNPVRVELPHGHVFTAPTLEGMEYRVEDTAFHILHGQTVLYSIPVRSGDIKLRDNDELPRLFFKALVTGETQNAGNIGWGETIEADIPGGFSGPELVREQPARMIRYDQESGAFVVEQQSYEKELNMILIVLGIFALVFFSWVLGNFFSDVWFSLKTLFLLAFFIILASLLIALPVKLLPVASIIYGLVYALAWAGTFTFIRWLATRNEEKPHKKIRDR